MRITPYFSSDNLLKDVGSDPSTNAYIGKSVDRNMVPLRVSFTSHFQHDKYFYWELGTMNVDRMIEGSTK